MKTIFHIASIVFFAILCPVTQALAMESFTGEKVLWRPRQQLIFYLANDKGGKFNLSLSVRDMNVYLEGEQPVYVFVIGPDGRVLADKLIPDDGIVSGDPENKDGYADIGMDVRYREYHRANSPGGYPPHKKRSEFLQNPEKLRPRLFTIEVPDAGRGIYRVYIGSCWDHWISITPDKPMHCGVYPGRGAMYVHGNRLKKAYLYVPENTRDISFALSEEIRPYNWTLKTTDESGKVVSIIKPRTFLNYSVAKDVKKDSVLELNVKGNTSGACLHIKGVPMIICSTPETARKIGEYCKNGSSDPDFDKIMDWARNLKPEDLKLEHYPVPQKIGSLSPKAFVAALKSYQPVPGKKKYGLLGLKSRNKGILPYITHKKSPYYNNGPLVRRIWLHCIMKKIRKFDNSISFAGIDNPRQINIKNAFQLIRSSWWPLNDAKQIEMLEGLHGLSRGHVPDDVIKAAKNLYEKWALARMQMEQGICSNQWTYELKDMAVIAQYTKSSKVKEALDYNVKRFCRINNLGRSNPDKTPFSNKSLVRYTYSSDTGRIGGGVPAECLGHDAEYGLESCGNMAVIWEKYRYPEIVSWLNEYYITKTHLTLPKSAKIPQYPFSDTCSPSDMNTRTRYYTHKSGIQGIHSLIDYGPIWEGKKSGKPWPCMESGTFFRNIDNRWFFVKTTSYYAIVFGGAGEPDSMLWNQSELKDNSAEFVGMGGMGYGGYQRAKKPGGFSAIWVPGCGPVSVGSNHNVMYSNTVWGRRQKPLYRKWAHNVDPNMIAECFGSPDVQCAKNGRRYIKSSMIPRSKLKCVRTIELKDNSIDITLQLTATENIDLLELNETIPLFMDDRSLSYKVNGNFVKYKMPETLVTPTHKSLPGIYNGVNPAMKTFYSDEVKLTAPNDSGMKIKFNKKYNIHISQPLKYRNEASTMSGLNLTLPSKWEKGKTVIIEYSIMMLIR